MKQALLFRQLHIIIIIIIIIIISYFMQSIYNYISETNHISRIYNIAAILWLQYMVKVKVNFTLERPLWPRGGVEVLRCSFFNLGGRWG